MSDESKPKAAPKPAAAKGEESVYVVQKEYRHTPSETVTTISWVDVGEPVKLPARSHRSKAIAKALEKAGIKADAGMNPLRIRVLDADSAFVREVPVVVAEPKFDL